MFIITQPKKIFKEGSAEFFLKDVCSTNVRRSKLSPWLAAMQNLQDKTRLDTNYNIRRS